MVPVYTSVEDMRKLLGYMAKQIGWVEQSKLEKALGATDDRKVNAMVALGLVQRDGSNLKLAQRGQAFASGDEAGALKEAVREVELYRHTVEWVHYQPQSKSEVTATEIGQYWEASHQDTLGALSGGTLNAGAVCFARVAEGAGFGTFKVGRSGKETRLTTNREAIAAFVDGVGSQTEAADAPGVSVDPPADADAVVAVDAPRTSEVATLPPTPTPTLSVSASPSVHVNVEIHIAADATADTVREIFRNMARYVLDKHVDDDGV